VPGLKLNIAGFVVIFGGRVRLTTASLRSPVYRYASSWTKPLFLSFDVIGSADDSLLVEVALFHGLGCSRNPIDHYPTETTPSPGL